MRSSAYVPPEKMRECQIDDLSFKSMRNMLPFYFVLPGIYFSSLFIRHITRVTGIKLDRFRAYPFNLELLT